jgi:hypothetical protein
MKNEITSIRVSELFDSVPFYVSAVYYVEFNGGSAEVEIDTNTFECKISYSRSWTDEQKQLIAKNVIPKFKRYATNLNKYFNK